MSKVSGEGGEAAEAPQPAKSTFVKASDQKVTIRPAQTSCIWRTLVRACMRMCMCMHTVARHTGRFPPVSRMHKGWPGPPLAHFGFKGSNP